MEALLRLLAITLPILLLPGAASAQVEVAPPPHPTLDEVVKEYLRLELPLPPKDAPLVRIHFWRSHEDGSRGDRFHVLGFRLPASRPGADPRYWIGSGDNADGPLWIDPRDVEKCEPAAAAEAGAGLLGREALHLAIFCKARGWNGLAAALYARTWKEWEGYDEAPILLRTFRQDALFMWMRRLREPASDRGEILAHLKKLLAQEPELRDEKQLGLNATAFVKNLQATIEHRRKGPPGSVEDLIDDLVDYRPDSITGAANGARAYRKLVELGFDAVPALIDHLDDRRLTRTDPISALMSNVIHQVDVGHLCNQILSGLAANELQHPTSRRATKADATEWFEKARKRGEEKWLLDHTAVHETLEVLGARYPDRLAEVYRTALKKPVADRRVNLAMIVKASTLPKERKTALLEQAAAHEHISFQLEAVAQLGGAVFRKRLLATLKQIELRQQNEQNYLWEPSGEIWTLASLVAKSNEPACWDILAEIAKRLPGQLRTELIDAVGWAGEPDAPDPARAERIRFLVRFLDDRSKEEIEVRDFAAAELAGLFRMPVARIAFSTSVMHNPDAGPLARVIWRAAVIHKAQEELKRRN